MAKGKKVQPRRTLEYRLLLAQVYDEKLKQIVTRAVLRTVTEFTSFKYELVVESLVNGHELRFNIQGLRAPRLSMPEVGPALYTTTFADLRGTYNLVVSKLGKDENAFVVTFDERAVEVKEVPPKPFIELVTDSAHW